MDGCKPNSESDPTAEIRNEDGIKDVTDIILTLVLDCLFLSEKLGNQVLSCFCHIFKNSLAFIILSP